MYFAFCTLRLNLSMRKGPVPKRELEPDVRYDSVLVSRFINYVMQRGNKSMARKIVYGALGEAEKKLGKSALEVMDKVIQNAGPEQEVRSRRVGGANYQIPYPVKADRKITLAYRWIIQSARNKKGKSMQQKLTQELLETYNNTGAAVKKKDDIHRMAAANKAFAHFAWGKRKV